MQWISLLCTAGWLASAVLAQQPPLLDRELFFGDPEITAAQISPDGQYIAFLKPWNKTRNIWVKRAEQPFSQAKLITNDTKRPIPGFFWSRDSKSILFVQDKAGDENYLIYAVNPADNPPSGADVPPSRNLTDLKGVRAMIYAVPRSEPDIIYVGLNDRDKAWHDLYKIRISTGERTLLRQNTDRVTAWIFDLKDQLRMATRSADNGDTEILRVDASGFQKVYSCDVFESCTPIRFHKDGRRFYMATNKGSQDLTRLVLFDPSSLKEEEVESDPLKHVDFGNAMFSEVSDELIGTVYLDERERVYWRDKAYEADHNWLKSQLPGAQLGLGSHTRDEQRFLVSASSDTDPGATYLFDRKARQLTLQYRLREQIKREYLAEMKPVRYKSSDGLEIPAYLTLPKGVPPKNLPAIVLPHGGPWGRDLWGYNGMVQFLANRGYAVLTPNFRSSTGYGKAFLNAGNRQWGDKMQDDITWGVKYLVAEGIADSKRVGIMGGSYGGYATLAGVAFTPDVYAAAVSIVGPSNLITLLNSIPPYWEQIRTLFYKRMGDPNTPEGKAQLTRQSPLTAAARIKTPLMVVQGANDPRVNKAESDQIVIALRDRGFPVEYLVAPDEGHGFTRPVNNLAMFTAAEKFLAKHLGGRYQEGATPEVAQRLMEIKVDPKTVVLPKKVEAASAVLPKPAVPMHAGTYNYAVNLKMGDRSMDMKVVTAVKEDAGGWSVSDTMTTPMGEVVSTALLDKNTLALRRSQIQQGPVNIKVDYTDSKATGSMNMNGQDKPIDAALDGPLFADAAGPAQSLACLPLAPDYTVVYRNFDIQQQKAKLMRLTVAAVEDVKVPAGTFKAFKLEVQSADGGSEKTTFWVDQASRKVVRTSATMPRMGGAVMNAELTQ